MPDLVPLVGAIWNLLLALFVLLQGWRTRLNQVYALLGTCIAIWNYGTYHMFLVNEAASALFWARFLQFGVIFIPVLLFHLSLLIAHIRVGKYIYPIYAVFFGLALSNLSGYFVSDVRNVGYAWYSVAGPGFWVYSVAFNLTIVSILVLLRKRRTLPPLHKRRLTGLLVAQSCLVILGANDILPILRIDHYPLTQNTIQIYPFGSMAAIFYGIIVGYSVLQHQLLDIHLTLSRFAAQMVRLLFMFLIGLSLLLLVVHFAPDQFSRFAIVAALAVLLASAIIASFVFPQFFGKGTDALERQILGDRFEYHARVQNLIQTMRSFPDAQFLMDELQELIISTMKAHSYQIILLDDTTRTFALFHSHPPRPQVQLADLHVDSPVFRYFQKHQTNYLSCNPNFETKREVAFEREAREQLKLFEPEFCFPFFSGNELIGMMLLGGKVNEDFYTPHDLFLLSELARSLSLLLNQVRLRQQLQVAHEQDLLGRMSRGLAHDLNNLLTPVQTVLQLFQSESPAREVIDDLVVVALRNMDTVRSYVNEALFFSRASTLHSNSGPIGEAIKSAVELLRPTAQEKNIEVFIEELVQPVIEMDSVLIKRLLCNLLSNAIDASAPDSKILIRVMPLPRTEMSRDWYRLQIIDSGDGISPENLRRVFTPYFTTKNTGDGKRGFGLGLAIARKIVHLHGGNLSISSKEKKGTTVQVDLPNVQPKVQNATANPMETVGA